MLVTNFVCFALNNLKENYIWTIKLIFVRILRFSIFGGGVFDIFGRRNKNVQPAIQTLNGVFISTCDNKPPARTFSHNYVPQKVNLAHSYSVFFLLFAD